MAAWDKLPDLTGFDLALAKEGVSGKLADVARSIYQQESGGGKNIKTSNAGAVGGMQIIPATFKSVANKDWDINNPDQNMQAGIRYLKQLDKQSGGVPELTAAGYYGGPGGMEKARRGVAVSDPRNPNAPTTLQYGQQVAARIKNDTPVVNALNAVAGAVIPSAQAATPAKRNAWDDLPDYAPTAQPDLEKGYATSIFAGLGAGTGKVALGAQGYLGKGLRALGADGAGQWLIDDATQGRSKIASEVAPYKAANPISAGGGELAGEIVATLPVGGGLAGLLSKIPGLATKAPAVIQGLKSSGMNVGGLTGKAGVATRIGTGAAVAGGSTALINPEDAALGAVIGGAAGPLVAGAAKLGGGAANLYRSAFAAPETRLAQKIATAADIAPDKLRALLSQQGPQIVQNYQKTVPQILQNPAISQLQRTLKTAGNDALGGAERLQQQQFMETLNRVAPVQTTVQDAAERAGGAIQDFALPAEKLAAERTAKLFDSIPVNEAQIMLPLQKMQEAQSKFLPPGSFGKGVSEVEQAMRQATNIGTEPLSPLTQKVVPFNQIQALRSSISDAITKAQKDGQNQAVAALTQMKSQIDNKVAAVASGELLPGEIFTPQAIDTWGRALASHASKKQQFNTGPQIGIFRQGGDGQKALQGAEIPGKFYSGRNSQVNDLLSFKRLLSNDANAPALTRDLQSYATTQAANTTNAAGNLTSKYGDWLRSRSGANRELFGPDQNAALKAIDDAVTTGANAENLGRISGSDTAQKLVSLQSNGLLDNRVVDVLANRIWGISSVTGPILESLRNTAGKKQSDIFARLLANPQELEAALKTSPQLSGELAKALMQAQTGLGKVAPAIYAD